MNKISANSLKVLINVATGKDMEISISNRNKTYITLRKRGYLIQVKAKKTVTIYTLSEKGMDEVINADVPRTSILYDELMDAKTRIRAYMCRYVFN